MVPLSASPGRGRRFRSARGAELIELALVSPVVLVLLGGILDFGFLFNNYTVVTNAAREGARMAALPGSAEADVKERVNKYIQAAGLTLSGVSTTVQPVAVVAGGSTVNAIKVQVSYPYNYMILGPLVQMVGGGSFTGITLKTAATMRREVAAGL
jgi:Flp pilus assembly protein TadG